ncbi:MAG: hypothetical protein DME99_08495 [Verrucomicrobia bacterium]|nr:MAG: hypothetical protein DME99_08495 [Verrucomicrobiota bacterium]
MAAEGLCLGERARASRAGDRALAIANFLQLIQLFPRAQRYFGEGAEMCTRGACAPRAEYRSARR